MYTRYWLLFAGTFVSFFSQALVDKDLNTQKTHRNIASKGSFRSQDTLHDHHHRQFQQLNSLTSFSLDRAIAQASASSHYRNHHAFPNIEGINDALTTEISGFPITNISEKLHSIVTTDSKVFALFSNSLTKIQELTGGSASLFAESSEALTMLAAGGGYVVALGLSGAVHAWDSSGTKLSEISPSGQVSGIAVNGESSGSIYMAIENQVHKYQANGSLVDTFPNQNNIDSIVTSDDSNIFLQITASSSTQLFNPLNSSFLTGKTLETGSGSVVRQTLNNKLFLGSQVSTPSFAYIIKIADFSDIQNPVEGVYHAGEDIGHITIAGNKLFAIATNVITASNGASRVLGAWSNLSPATFPSGGTFFDKELTYDDFDFFIESGSSSDLFTLVAGGSDYVFAYSIEGGSTHIRSFLTSNGAPSGYSFTVPSGFISSIQRFVANSSNQLIAVYNSDPSAILVWPSTGGPPTTLTPKPSGGVRILIAEGSYIAAMYNLNRIDVWNSSGTHLQSITTTGNNIESFAIDNTNGGTVYVLKDNSQNYERYSIATGLLEEVVNQPSLEKIDQITVSPEEDTGTPLIYVTSDGNSKIVSINSDTGTIRGSSNTSIVSKISSMKAGGVDFLFYTLGNVLNFVNGGESADIANPFATATVPQSIIELAATSNGNVFAGNSDSVHAWSTDGSSITPLSESPFPLSGIVRLMAAESDLYVVHDINVAGV